MILYIRNMVCIRCKVIVNQELIRLNLHPIHIDLGSAEIMETLSPCEKENFNTAMQSFGLELMEDRRSILIEKIKKVIHEFIYDKEEPVKINFSCYLSKQLNYDYTYLANVFSLAEGLTIEHYMISQKIERVKDLLFTSDLSLKEIAYTLHYSSTAHLSNQFKKITGTTTSSFREKQKQHEPDAYMSYQQHAMMI